MGIRDYGREVAELAVEWGTGTGIMADTQTVRVRGAEADFRVRNHTERWRAGALMDERAVVDRVLRAVGPDTTFWDVGSAVGTYAVLAAVRGADCVAIEPAPPNHDRLRENIALNGVGDRVQVVPAALGAAEGIAELELADERAGVGRHRIRDGGDVAVPVRRGDDLDAPAPDVIKIDVEGGEREVLAGMPDALAHARFVVVEVHPQHGVDPERVREQVRDAGLSIDHIRLDRDEIYVVGTRES